MSEEVLCTKCGFEHSPEVDCRAKRTEGGGWQVPKDIMKELADADLAVADPAHAPAPDLQKLRSKLRRIHENLMQGQYAQARVQVERLLREMD